MAEQLHLNLNKGEQIFIVAIYCMHDLWLIYDYMLEGLKYLKFLKCNVNIINLICIKYRFKYL